VSDFQDNDPTGLPPCSECQECNGFGGRWDDEAIDQWYWCCHCDAAVIAAAKSQKYDSTYKGQLKKCGDERSALEQTVDDLSKENKQLRADLAKANARIEALESEASTLEDQIRDLHYERGMEQP
jgi:septal ring factor EnvC (AmiA/AmiB activator)